MVNDVKLAVVARRMRRPVGDGRLVAVARAQGTGLAVTGQGSDEADHAVAPAFLEGRRRGPRVLGGAAGRVDTQRSLQFGLVGVARHRR